MRTVQEAPQAACAAGGRDLVRGAHRLVVAFRGLHKPLDARRECREAVADALHGLSEGTQRGVETLYLRNEPVEVCRVKIIDDLRQLAELVRVAGEMCSRQRGERAHRICKLCQLRQIGALQFIRRVCNASELSADAGRNPYITDAVILLQCRGKIRQLFNISFEQLCRRVGDLFDLIRRGGQTGAALGYGLELPQCIFQQFKPV